MAEDTPVTVRVATPGDRLAFISIVTDAFAEDTQLHYMCGSVGSPPWLRSVQIGLLYNIIFEDCINRGLLLITSDRKGVLACGWGDDFEGVSMLVSLLLFCLLVGPVTFYRLT